jgi:hypothetical protein
MGDSGRCHAVKIATRSVPLDNLVRTVLVRVQTSPLYVIEDRGQKD